MPFDQQDNPIAALLKPITSLIEQKPQYLMVKTYDVALFISILPLWMENVCLLCFIKNEHFRALKRGKKNLCKLDSTCKNVQAVCTKLKDDDK